MFLKNIATAYLCGVKTRYGVIGLNGNARLADCQSSLNAQADSILKWAHNAGKSVGKMNYTN
jgi:alkaline phosphatase